MAITINGSGTITGVSAGGLPDGSITADDLASTLDISGKTVTLPSNVGGITTGKLLQVKQVGFDIAETSLSSDSNMDIFDTSITTQSNSKLLCFVETGQLNRTTSSANLRIRFEVDGTDVSRHLSTDDGTGNHWWYQTAGRVVYSFHVLTPALTAASHNITVNATSLYGGFTINYQGKYQGQLTMMEIAE